MLANHSTEPYPVDRPEHVTKVRLGWPLRRICDVLQASERSGDLGGCPETPDVSHALRGQELGGRILETCALIVRERLW